MTGSNLYGWNKMDHVTIYGTTYGISYGYASSTSATNTIIANVVNAGHYSSDGSPYSYSDLYGCNPNVSAGAIDTGNNLNWDVGLDPQFASTDPGSPYFLWLKPTSPACGMGARPCNPPDDIGACCLADGTCSETTEQGCTGIFQGASTDCGSVSCPQPPELGACCAADGSCTETTQADCTDTFQGVGTTCATANCPQPPGPGCSLGLADALQNVSFNRFPENPIIEPSPDQYPNGMWTDNLHTLHQCVRRKDASSPYMMWYTGKSNHDYPRRIHLATSNDGINFTKVGAVLGPGAYLGFDGAQVHMPTVIWHDNQWKMWYAGHRVTYCDGPCTPEQTAGWNTIGYATSPDGINWTKYGQVFDVDPDLDAFDSDTVREPTVLFDPSDSLFKMWYNGTKFEEHFGPTGYATSPDGINWTRIAQVSQTEDFLRGGVIKIGGFFYMFYNNQDRIDYAVSADGIDWLEYDGNPVMVKDSGTWEAGYLQAPSLVYEADQNKLIMYYNAFDGSTERIGGAWTMPFYAIIPPPSLFGDFDDDGDVDMEDFGFLQVCLGESGLGQMGQGCDQADLTCDFDVDENDVSVIRACLSGANVPVDPACAQ